VNPYEILGVGRNAAEQEIKTAYRALVKKYHPDRNHTDEAKQKIKEINEAYEILSDPTKKLAFDNPGNYLQAEQYVYEEDPREVYKREYIRRKNQEAKEKKEKELRFKKRVHQFLWMLSLPLSLLASILLIDYFLSPSIYREVAVRGWQERLSGGRNSQGPLVSYMETESFVIEVPSEIHVHYDYDTHEKLTIEATPIFKTPKSIIVKIDKNHYSFDSLGTVYMFGVTLPFLLFVFSSITFLKREFSLFSYIMSFTQIFFAIIIGLKMNF
jgi:hypothetical protein